jgi:hypothetical protein
MKLRKYLKNISYVLCLALIVAIIIVTNILSNINSVLTISDCKLPCWNNITPGETTLLEAKGILESTPGMVEVNYFEYKQNVSFQMSLGELGVSKIYGDINGDPVQDIWLAGKLNIDVNELFELLGSPNNISSTQFGGGGITFLGLYPSDGAAFKLLQREKEINQKTKISALWLFDPSEYEHLIVNFQDFDIRIANGEDVFELMYPWKGYGNIYDLYPPK